ncbi:MAG: hypothetical protein IJ438_02200 [Clostridia bacterium]|nr:hypothetical protein [Clostridia bacterium]
MKMKSLLCMLLAVLLLPGIALAEESTADTLMLSELTEWAARYQARAIASEPLNIPKESITEDGYEFIYDFATLYADTPVMSKDTEISAVVITSPKEEGPRGTMVDDTIAVILAAYYNENDELAGSRESAALYRVDLLPDMLQWAQVQRDGQRVETIQYAVHEQLTTGGDGYTDAGVIYTMQDGTVSAIRVYGLDSRITEQEMYAVYTSVRDASVDTSYVQVPFSYDGASLTPFDGEDLHFSGLPFASMKPEDAITVLGEPIDDQWLEDGENGYIRTMTFAECEITFLYDAARANAEVYMLLITEDGFEGPRAVRIGDTFASVFNRFRNGEGEFDGLSREVLYGDENSGVFGVAEYGADASATLRYGLVLEDGSRVVLHLTFTTMELSEVMLYVK